MKFFDTVTRAAATGLAAAAVTSALATDKILSGFPGARLRLLRTSDMHDPPKYSTSHFHVPLKHVSNAHEHPRTGADLALGFAQRQLGDGFGYTNVTVANKYGTSFAIDVSFNNHTMPLIVDSGSSDTWAVSSDFDCVDWMGTSFDQVTCGFGSPFPGAFNEVVKNQHFFIQYGSGEQISGPLGKIDVTVAGITVQDQEVALANLTYWNGNNYTAGLVGLAYPSLTSAYYGSDQTSGSDANQISYNPLFTEMMNQGLIDQPIWSIAINRNSSDGVIAFGGIVDSPTLWEAPVGWTDIIITDIISTRPETSYKPSFYTIIPDGLLYGQSMNTAKYPYIIDTGTTLMYLPPQLAEAVNAAFDPPASYVWMYGGYFTSCDAVPPRFAVEIGEEQFWVNPIDMIFRSFQDPITGLCQTAIASGGSGPYILGSTFLQNTVTVFDVGKQVMAFYSRPYY
ncbi:aspartic-type endopeptidase-like protein [Zalerion maritima]|uniref:Aspartic-type endopeptidase-like protein n=1 Tax=Zalerion maritima TaxID=339359 RepID=A0AAD5RQ17_9PEZI|nr:aspartic-type endopeptidase-like protein [Zalerion maritima]